MYALSSHKCTGHSFFVLLAAFLIKRLHYKLLITIFCYKYSQHNYPYRIFGLWIYCITHGATCQLALCGASHSLGVFILNSGAILHEGGRAAYRAGWGAEWGSLCQGRRYGRPMGSWCDSGLPTVPGSGSSPSPACLLSRWPHAPSKLARDSTQAAESFPYLTTPETLYIDKLQRLSA